MISADGRFVVFISYATDLVPGDTNVEYDLFLRDRVAGTTTRVSVASAGAQALGGPSYNASISADGRYISFYSYATDLVAGDTNARPDVFLHDRATGATTRINVSSAGQEGTACDAYVPSISGDGRFIAYYSACDNLVADDTNTALDVFVHDQGTV
jgi:Tol biopolymer transport system component